LQLYYVFVKILLKTNSCERAHNKANSLGRQKAQGNPITILNRNKPTAYLVPASTYEALLEQLEDHELGKIILERKAQKDEAIEVSIDDL